MKNVIILRGISGSGKSSFCELIKEPKVVCCADFLFEKDGGYDWDVTKLGEAHAQCRKAFDEALMNPYVENIIIANVNAKPSDYQYYVGQSNMAGAKVSFVVLEKRHNGENIHNVPSEVLLRQANTLKQDMILL